MKSLAVPNAGELELIDVPQPTIGAYDALVRIEACGICNTTDTKVIHGDMFWAPPFPVLLGHESVGTVVEVGSKVRKFRVGQRVTRPVSSFGSNPELPNPAFGGFSEYGIVRDAEAMAADGDDTFLTDYNAIRQSVVDAGVDPVRAALCISLAETSGTLINMPAVRGKTVVVAGTGIAGLGFTLWAALAGASVITLGRRRERLDLAQRVGAFGAVDTRDEDFVGLIRDLAPNGVDGVIDATGDVGLAAKLDALIGENSFAVAYGVGSLNDEYPRPWARAKVEEHRTYRWVLDMYKKGLIDIDVFLTHTWPFDHVIDAFEQVQNRTVLKGVVVIDRGGEPK